MTEIYSISIPNNWDYVHTKLCKYFDDNMIAYKYIYMQKEDKAEYTVDSDTMFTIRASRVEVLYDNEYDIELKVLFRGGDSCKVLKYCQDIKDIMQIQTACAPGESNFDDLIG